jgi:hypothetical protein
MLAKEAEEEKKGDWVMAMHMRFALAKAYDDIGDYGTSFRYLNLANAGMLRKSMEKIGMQNPSDVLHNARGKLAMNKEVFSTKGFGNPAPFDKKGPIFIVGLPRTGSTLIETVRGHSHVTWPRGESLPAWEPSRFWERRDATLGALASPRVEQ